MASEVLAPPLACSANKNFTKLRAGLKSSERTRSVTGARCSAILTGRVGKEREIEALRRSEGRPPGGAAVRKGGHVPYRTDGTARIPVRGNRADCIHCEGNSRLTVSIREETYYCHRCERKGGINSLLRELGEPVTPETAEEIARRDERERFNRWRDAAWWCVVDWLYQRSRLAELASATLAEMPDVELAWEILREYYDAESVMMSALEELSCEKNPDWIETPMVEEKLLAIYRTAVNVSAGVAA